jgi:hypothetical protein
LSKQISKKMVGLVMGLEMPDVGHG